VLAKLNYFEVTELGAFPGLLEDGSVTFTLNLFISKALLREVSRDYFIV
jgi:hypothetical protein